MKKTLTMSFRPQWRNLLGIKSKLQIKKKVYAICIGLITLNLPLITHNSLAQNVGINSDGSSPDSNTMLEIKSTDNTSSSFGLKVKDSSGDNKIVVRSDGNVGIGTTSPNYKLHIANAGLTHFALDNTATGGDEWSFTSVHSGTNDGSLQIKNEDEGIFALYSNPPNGTGLFMSSDGRNVGINERNPGHVLSVKGNGVQLAGNAYAIGSITDGAYNKGIHIGYDNSLTYSGLLCTRSGPMEFWTSTGSSFVERMRIDDSGGAGNGYVGIWTTTPGFVLDVNGTTACTGNVWTSDVRKKKNIKELEINGLDVIDALNPVTYQWKEVFDEGMKGTQMGFIAQEIETILPSMVVTANDSIQSKSVKYNELLPILVTAIKEQQQIITDQENEMQEMKSNISQLESNNEQIGLRLRLLEEHLKTANK